MDPDDVKRKGSHGKETVHSVSDEHVIQDQLRKAEEKRSQESVHSVSEEPANREQLRKLRASDVSSLKEVLSSDPLFVRRSAVGSLSAADHRAQLDGVSHVEKQRSTIPNSRADLVSIKEDGNAEFEDQKDNNTNKKWFPQLLNLEPINSHSVPNIEKGIPTLRKEKPSSSKHCQVDLISLTEVGHQVNSITTSNTPLRLMSIAADIAINDTIAYCCDNGYLETTSGVFNDGITYKHPSQCLRTTEGFNSLDATTQTGYYHLDTADTFPSQLDHRNFTGDEAIQCELVPAEEMVDLGAAVMSYKGSKKSVTILEADAWLKNHSDMAVSCYLPPDATKSQRTTPASITLPSLSDMVAAAVDDVTNKMNLTKHIHQSRVNILQASILRSLLERLSKLSAAKYLSNTKLVNWVSSTGLLTVFASQLLQMIDEALTSCFGSLYDVKLTDYERLIEPEEDGSSDDEVIGRVKPQDVLIHVKELREVECVMEFSSVLEDRPVKASSDIKLDKENVKKDSLESIGRSDVDLRKSRIHDRRSSHMSSRVGQRKSTASTVLNATQRDKAVTTDDLALRFMKNSRRVSIGGQQIELSGDKWKKVKDLTINKQKSTDEMIRLKRMAFLDDLMKELSDEETSLLQAIFLTVNKSGSCFITVPELCQLLSEAFSRSFPESIGRRIMSEIDVDKDGSICLLDLFGLFYLTEVYMQALGDGFRDEILRDTSSVYTASHALVFIAISELCFYHGYRLSMETNIFIRQCEKSNIIRLQGHYIGAKMANLETTVCRFFCFSLLGLDNGVLESICENINDICRLKMSALWPDESRGKAKYNQYSKRYEFSDVITRAYNRHKEFCYRSSYFGALTDLSLPPTLPVITVNPRLSLKPPYMFCQQGKDTLRRVIDTGHGLENRHNARANQHSLSVLQSLEKQGVTLAQLFLEKALFYNHKLENVVKTYCYNAIPMWPRLKDTTKQKSNPSSHGFNTEKSTSKIRHMNVRVPIPFQIGAMKPPAEEDVEIKLPDINLRQTPTPLSDAMKKNREIIEQMKHKYGKSVFNYRNLEKVQEIANQMDKEFHDSLKESYIYRSVKTWKERERVMKERQTTSQLAALYDMHCRYFPQIAKNITIPGSNIDGKGSRPSPRNLHFYSAGSYRKF